MPNQNGNQNGAKLVGLLWEFVMGDWPKTIVLASSIVTTLIILYVNHTELITQLIHRIEYHEKKPAHDGADKLLEKIRDTQTTYGKDLTELKTGQGFILQDLKEIKGRK